MPSMYTCYANSRNLLVSDTSWSMYLNLSTQPDRFGVACTPSRMRNNIIEVLGCLHGDRVMGCFPFLIAHVLEVPTSSSLSSPLDSGCPVISSIWISSHCADPTTSCGVDPTNCACLLSPPFVLWAASTLTGYYGFPVATGSWPCALSYESISILTVTEACSSFSTNVELTGSTCSKGIASTLMIPSLCVVSCSTSGVSCGDQRLLHVFCVVWLGVPTFGGSIVGNYFFPD
jgi:hypothetical protein